MLGVAVGSGVQLHVAFGPKEQEIYMARRRLRHWDLSSVHKYSKGR